MTDDVQPSAPAAMPYWESRIVVAIAVAVLTHIIAALHLESWVATGEVASLVNDGFQIATVIAAGIAVHARVVQKAAPQITGTKSAAAFINAQ
jgi:hypothetical protein